MTFLDFEGTLFDSQAFATYVREKRITDIATHLFERGELAQFVYEDAAAFLRAAENSAIIITSGDNVYQKQKIEGALAGIPRLSIMCTNGVPKGKFIAPYIDMYGAAKFIDDSVHELELLAETCPTFRLLEMRRDGNRGDGRWPVVTTLDRLS